ncbi:MAG: hypothetical protein PHI79_00465 [Sulfurovaceae bacterium]|nr:hypothetical protein [Sulfurovaceae bacterium]MDD5548051.1 hypothetical protein [Sulfurovaceae bacterium]
MNLSFNFFKNILNKLFLLLQFFLVFIYIIFEEIIWNFIAKPIYNFIESLNAIQKLDELLRSTNRYIILITFVLLFVLVELLGIVAGGLIVSGNIFVGTGLYLAKIPIAVFTYWMFKVVRSKLMTFYLFRVSFNTLENILSLIKNSYIYKSTIDVLIKTKEYIKSKLQYFKDKIIGKKGRFIYRIKRFYFFIKQRYK